MAQMQDMVSILCLHNYCIADNTIAELNGDGVLWMFMCQKYPPK